MSQELTDEDLAAMRTRVSSATPGPWISYIEGRNMMSGSSFIQTRGEDIYLSGATEADQDFIASAREDIPRLLLEIERLRDLISATGKS